MRPSAKIPDAGINIFFWYAKTAIFTLVDQILRYE
jgi:hypothetical protein